MSLSSEDRDAIAHPVALALLRRQVLSDEDVRGAEAALAAQLAAHPDAPAFWQALDELRRLTEQLDREADSA